MQNLHCNNIHHSQCTERNGYAEFSSTTVKNNYLLLQNNCITFSSCKHVIFHIKCHSFVRV